MIMINLRDIEHIIYLITFAIAYLITETICGWFRAYTAKKMGDDTAQELGFLTLNPFPHIDWIGFIFLLHFGFGWGKAAPISPENITKPHRTLKLCCAYFSDTIAHLFLALLSFVLLISIFGTKMIEIIDPMMYHKNISLPYLTYFYPHSPSFVLSIAIILAAMMYLSIILAVLNFIVNGFRLVMLLFFNESLGLWYIDLVVPILLILLFANSLQKYVIDGITFITHYIAYFIGLI